ncbi:MAG: hypothetical protein BWX95_01722 [Bacteroidetes bacterium ADurb.Bin141]|nr:MAG: hypothetical protein BWX95_01722 [Bacteroidetes bacterium ADurb.Bin141]
MIQVILFLSLALASGLLFTNIYNSMIDAKSWGTDIPRSIETAREYLKAVNPGNFFRIFSPINQVLALVALVLFWKSSPTVRIYLGITLVLYVLSELFTFSYFYPRNDIMFKNSLTDIDAIRKAWTGWNSMNRLRSFILFAGIIFSFMVLHKTYTSK